MSNDGIFQAGENSQAPQPQYVQQPQWDPPPQPQPQPQPAQQPQWDPQAQYAQQPQWDPQPQPQYGTQTPGGAWASHQQTWGAPGTPPEAPKSKGPLVALILAIVVILIAVGGGAGYYLTRDANTTQSVSNGGPGAGPAAQGQLFRVSFKSGETRNYTMDVKTTGSMTDPSGKSGTAPFNMKMTGGMTISVVEKVPDGSTKIQLTFTNIKMSGEVDGTSMPDMTIPLPAQKFTIRPDGSVETSEGVTISGPASGSGTTGSPFGFASPVPIFPDRPVTVGDNWSDESEITVPGSQPIVVKTDNVFEGYEQTQWGNAAKIRSLVKSDFSFDLSKIAGTSGSGKGLSMPATGTIDYSLRYLFIPESGEVVKTTIDSGRMNLHMEMPVPGSPSAFDMQMDMTGEMVRKG